MRFFYVSWVLVMASIAASAAEPVATLAIPPAASAPLPQTIPTPAADYHEPLRMPAPQAVTAELNDGSKIEFDAGGVVYVLNADGTKDPAPDGTLTLKDGTPLVVKNGMRVSGE